MTPVLPRLATMADLIAAPEPKWLAEALRITGPVSCGTLLYEESPDGGVWRLGDSRGHGNYADNAYTIPIPPIPFPADPALLPHLMMVASEQGWGGDDFEWIDVRLRATLEIADAGVGMACPSCPERPVWLESRRLLLPNGQPAYVGAGQCKGCGRILWSTLG